MATEMVVSYFSQASDFNVFLRGLSLLATGIMGSFGFRYFRGGPAEGKWNGAEGSSNAVGSIRTASHSAEDRKTSGEPQALRTELWVDSSVFAQASGEKLIAWLEKEHGVSIVVQVGVCGMDDNMRLVTILGSTREAHDKIVGALTREELKRTLDSCLKALTLQEKQVIKQRRSLYFQSTSERRGDSGRDDKLQMVALAQSSDEWAFCFERFHRRIRSNIFTITGIQRVQNERLWSHYSLHRAALENEMWLFHGTPTESVASAICAHGFNRSYAGRHGTAYGEGSYFADSSFYASYYSCCTDNRLMDASATYYMFLAQVLVGDFTQGAPGMKEPPLKNEGLVEGRAIAAGARYDSVVDKPDDPRIFVVFKDFQAYPSYLISFKLRSVSEGKN